MNSKPWNEWTKEEHIAHLEKIGQLDPKCAGCKERYENPRAFGPCHKASPRCESGKRAHCTCSACF